MTRKDYIAMAKVLEMATQQPNSHGRPTAAEVLRRRIAVDMAIYFASQNPRFNADKFIKAANVGIGVVA